MPIIYAENAKVPPVTQESSNTWRVVKWLLAGTVGGWGQVLSGQPFDTVKVRLQAQPIDKPVYSGVLDCANKTLASDGITGFYKGTLTPLVGIGACVALQFGGYQLSKRALGEKAGGEKLTTSGYFMAGMGAGLARSIASGPIEHIRIRLQVYSHQYSGPVALIRHLYEQGGFRRGIFKGAVATTLRDIPSYGFYFATYETCMGYLTQSGKRRDELSPLAVIGSGAIAGFALWVPMFPMDVVKSKFQTDSITAPKYTSVLQCFRSILAAEGIKGLYRGLTPCLLRAAPVNATTFMCFETALKALKLDA
eukprot:gnl/Hemi2/13804_TR4695_c0_g2_i1.p1 gnl/Hemi2/13804_TR4695_c0_g2~~gnl/Hemi2/13804_TR4695_c0_g2_i1.p1  ORF type:complete len:308 (-),score=96.98 gnl/Hemi2/13804_TR4695_c0_g2_i1:202-1125(-)